MVLLMPVTTARFNIRGTTAEGYAVAEEKALPVILSIPTGRHCPFLTLRIIRLNRRTSLSNIQPIQLCGPIFGVSCPPVK
jgi:hypothetical protein